MVTRFRDFFDSPFLRRVSWHVKRVGKKIDRRFFVSLVAGLRASIDTAASTIVCPSMDPIRQTCHRFSPRGGFGNLVPRPEASSLA